MKKLIALGTPRPTTDLMRCRIRQTLSYEWSRLSKAVHFGWIAASAGLIAGFSCSAGAADFGLGVSVKSGDTTLYFPIGVSPGFLIEPSLNYTHSDAGQIGGAQNETTSLGASVGLFGLKTTDHSVRLYYGARLGYVEAKQEFSFPGVPTQSRDQDGYRIAPLIGFEYLFNDHLSLGGEGGYYYSELDDDAGDGTFSNVILRYRF